MAMQAFSQEGSQWLAWKECVIREDIVYPSAKGPVITKNSLEKYEIFDHYSSGPDRFNPTISDKVLSYVLMNKKKEVQDICLYHLFAAVDGSDPEQIRRFIEVFGPLYLPPKDSKGALGDALNVDPKLLPPIRLIGPGFPLSQFIEEQQSFNYLVDRIQIYQDAVNSCLTVSEIKELERDIELRFFPYISLITPYIRFDRNEGEIISRSVWTWRVGNLLNALYFMLFMDLTTKGAPYKCANPRCNQFFYPIDKYQQTAYCSYTCYNRVNQRNNKARKKKVRELWREGKNSQEIAVVTGLEIDKITRWISTFKR
jgi:hypothetical protein